MDTKLEQLMNLINNSIKDGIPIDVKFSVCNEIITALIVAVITGIATYFANKMGGKSTLNMFKKQEDERIKANIEQEFYKKYEQMYLKLSGGMIDLKYLLSYNLDRVDSIKREIDIIVDVYGYNKIIVKKVEDYTTTIINDIDKLNQYLKSRHKIISNIDYKLDDEIELLAKFGLGIMDLNDICKNCKTFMKQVEFMDKKKFREKEIELTTNYKNKLGDMLGFSEVLNDINKKMKEKDNEIRKKFIDYYFVNND